MPAGGVAFCISMPRSGPVTEVGDGQGRARLHRRHDT